jgi:hypothetical protein
MKNAIFTFFLLGFFLTTQTADAKMSIFSPQDMINNSDYIVVGKIKKNITTEKHHTQFSELHREVTISVEMVLKGEITQKEIILKRDRRKDLLNPGEVSYDFPKRGTKVMLLLRNNANGLSLTYVNSICEINKNRISLYKGMEFRSRFKDSETYWSIKDYEETYQAIYDKALFK